jgi:3-phosphoshikimate 1-carboxyvinyltransferase
MEPKVLATSATAPLSSPVETKKQSSRMMLEFIDMQPVDHPVDSAITPPGSKSLTNRALIIAAMADGRSVLSGALDSDDTVAMSESLRRLGIEVEHDASAATMTVVGRGGCFPNASAELEIGNSGTSIRFLTGMLGFAGGNYTLDGIERMRERPIGPLVDALSKLGANIKAISPNACPPVKIDGPAIVGGTVSLSGNLSSQYLSGLLMAAPLASEDVTLQIDGPLISKPYVDMTCSVMNSFGVEVDSGPETSNQFVIPAGQKYQATAYAIEPDASAASYFWAVPAILGGTATVHGLTEKSLQGDVGFVRCLEKMGCEVEFHDNSISVTGPAKHGIHIDMSDVSDTVQTLAAGALFVEGPTTVTNIAHNRVKETDRIGNLAIELRKFGVQVDEQPDGLTIHPAPLHGAEIETYDDHRMAMSLSLVGLKQPGVRILDPGCVSKTYPRFFDDLRDFVK